MRRGLHAAAILLVALASFAEGVLDLKGLKPRTRLGNRVALGSCSARRCLTVFVAPWCGHCRNAAHMIQSLGQDMRWKGVKTRVVVCQDAPKKMDEYSRQFGLNALVDDPQAIRGLAVPLFVVSDQQGNVLRTHPGEFRTEAEALGWIQKENR